MAEILYLSFLIFRFGMGTFQKLTFGENPVEIKIILNESFIFKIIIHCCTEEKSGPHLLRLLL